MQIGKVAKREREEKGLMQKEVSAHLGIGNSNFNKLENGLRELVCGRTPKARYSF